MLIQSDEAAAQESDKWVRVEGTLGAMEIEGEKMAFIAADRVTPVKEPDSPYLY